MTSARRLFRLAVLVGATGLVAVAVVMVSLIGSVSGASPSLGALASACRQAVFNDLTIQAVAIMALASLGLVVVARMGGSLLRQARSMRRFLLTLGPTWDHRVGAQPVAVFERRAADAFCAGFLRPRVYLSNGAIDRLSDDELAAVVAHEAHHQRRRDPLRILLVRTMADALFFVPVLTRLSERYVALAELAADEAAVREAGGRGALASALLSFGERGTPAVVVGVAPERVEHLLGERARWRVSVALFAASLLATAALVALALVTTAATGGTPLTLSVLLAEACMVAMVIVPAGVTIAAVRLWRSSPARRLL